MPTPGTTFVAPVFSGSVLRTPSATFENQVIVNNGPGSAVLLSAAPGAIFPATGLPFPPGSKAHLWKNSTQLFAQATGLTPVTAAGIPASTTPITPSTTQDTVIRINGGAVSVVAVNGVTVATTTGVTVVVPKGQTIALTYTTIPTSWNWFGAQPANIAVTVGTAAT